MTEAVENEVPTGLDKMTAETADRKAERSGERRRLATAKSKATIEKKNSVLETLRIEYVPLNSIRPNSYNPNRQSDHEFELLVKSISEDGFTQPIVVNKESREFVDGEHRWTAALVVAALKGSGVPYAKWTPEMITEARENRLAHMNGDPGRSEIAVVFVDMPPEQMRISTLRHNRARGTEDVELSAQVLRDLRELGALEWAQDSLMLDDAEMQRLLEDISAPEALANEEFREAWLPEGASLDAAQKTEFTSGGGLSTLASTSVEAIERMRTIEKRLAEAKTEEERQAVISDRQVYRVNLTFTNDEAKLVRSVLGTSPADQMMKMCREWVEAHPDEVEEGKYSADGRISPSYRPDDTKAKADAKPN